MATNEEGGTYLYAVVPKSAAPKDLGEVSGVKEGKVYSVTGGELAAVVSDVPTREELRPERKLLSEHQQVLGRVIDESPAVLPVSFGTIAENIAGVRELLERYQGDFTQQIQKVEGKVEMLVRLTYVATWPNLFEFLIASDEGLRNLRDSLLQSGRQLTRDEKIDLGQKVDAVLTSLRDQYAEKLEQALSGIVEPKRNPPRSENELVNLACLVPKEKQADFDAVIQSAAALFPDSFVLEPGGPFPPYDFVQIHITAPAAGEA